MRRAERSLWFSEPCFALIHRGESRNTNKVLRFRASLSEQTHEVELALV